MRWSKIGGERGNQMRKKGIAIIISCFVIVVLAVLGGASLSRSISETHLSQGQQMFTQALWAAEGGIQFALRGLNTGDWTGWTDDGTGANKTISQTLGVSSYNISLVGVGTLSPVVTSTGIRSTLERAIDAVMDDVAGAFFTHAAFGDSEVKLEDNALTDSYESNLGPYGGGNVGESGDVGTNSDQSAGVKLTDSAQVGGDASTGAGGTVEVGGGDVPVGTCSSAQIDGCVSDESDREVTSVTVPTDLSNLTSTGIYLEDAGTPTLPGGDYHYDSFTVKGTANLTLQGTTRIYVEGNIKIADDAVLNIDVQSIFYVDGTFVVADDTSGNPPTLNSGGSPESFIIYSTYESSGPGDPGVSLGDGDEGAKLYGLIYAPDAVVEIKDETEIYGAVVGDKVKVTDTAKIHYDEQLNNLAVEGSNIRYSIQIWRELQEQYPLQ